jgi:hypothetical protein
MRRKEAVRNAGLLFLLVGLIMTISIAVESAADRHYQNQDRMRDKRLKELMLYKTLLERSDFGNSFTLDSEPW